MQYRSPALTGDATFLDGEVLNVDHGDASGQPLASVKVTMTNQDGAVMAAGKAEIELSNA